MKINTWKTFEHMHIYPFFIFKAKILETWDFYTISISITRVMAAYLFDIFCWFTFFKESFHFMAILYTHFGSYFYPLMTLIPIYSNANKQPLNHNYYYNIPMSGMFGISKILGICHKKGWHLSWSILIIIMWTSLWKTTLIERWCFKGRYNILRLEDHVPCTWHFFYPDCLALSTDQDCLGGLLQMTG